MQEVPTASDPPLSERLLDPDVAVPPQLLLKFGVPAVTTLAGKLSLNPIPLRAVALFGLVIVMVRVLTPFGCMPMGLNALAIVGGPVVG